MALGHKTGGRKKGSLNKATADIKAIAQQHTAEAVKALVDMLHDGGDAAKVAAARELLDRAYGKPTQPIAGDDSMPAVGLVVFKGLNADS